MNLSKAARQQLGNRDLYGADLMDAVWIDEECVRRLGFDYPLRQRADLYIWLTQEYLTKDFSISDLLKLCHIMESYPLETIEKAVKICRARGVYTAPYLAGVLETEGAQLVEDVRREMRITQRILETKPPVLPVGRYPDEMQQIYEHIKLRDEDGT